MKADGDKYILTMAGSQNDNRRNGQYYDDYHSKVIDSDSVIWEMNSTMNFRNYAETDDGIFPGCSGCLSFYITPKVDGDLPLEFTFELLGYNSETDSVTSEITMIPLDAVNDADVINYMNGHILFFENYDSETGKYSGLIRSNTDMQRVINRTFNGKGTASQVNIYWIWPLNLSTLVLPENDETKTLCSGTEYTSLENYVVAKPEYFMKGVTTSTENPLTATMIKNDYAFYGGRYDQADNVIGVRVQYMRLKMTIN